MKVATLAMMVAMTPAVAHAQCHESDWQWLTALGRGEDRRATP
jgi:hypothetical protein